MKQSEVETLILNEGRELQRRLLEDHIKLRGLGDLGASIMGADGIERTHKQICQRTLSTIFGEVLIERIGYSARGVDSLFPKDAALNLPKDSYSYGIQKIIVTRAVQNSFDEVVSRLKEITGISIPQRIAEELTIKAAVDFDEFYHQLKSSPHTQDMQKLPLVALPKNGKAIVMGVTEAHLGLTIAEAITKLRSLRSSKDFERYWEFHEHQEYLRNHYSLYMNPSILESSRAVNV